MTHALRELIGQSRISTEKSGRPFLPVTSLQVSVEVPSTTVESTGGTLFTILPSDSNNAEYSELLFGAQLRQQGPIP